MKKVLIAEDSTSWQNVHKEMLGKYEKFDFDIQIYSSAWETFESIKNDKNPRYDLILSDLQMEPDWLPEFAGEWLVKNIKGLSVYQKTPIVIVSAAYNISFIAENLKVDCLSKRTLVSNPESYFYMLDEHLK